MARNKLSDLNNHLFEQLERLNDDELQEEHLDQEVKRANAMAKIAQSIIGNAQIVLRAELVKREHGTGEELSRMLE